MREEIQGDQSLMRSLCRNLLSLFVAVSAIGASGFLESRANDNKTGKPKLAVIVVFDQLRGDYLEKWRDLFGEGGFKRLQTEGAWFTNCHYPYADTLTAPGHTSLVTGTSPYKHGIIANDWYDRMSGEVVSSIQSERYGPVPPPKPAGAAPSPYPLPRGGEGRVRGGAAPLRRREETIGDVLFRATKGKAKIGSLSIKDRAAILLAALRAQFVYWFSTSAGGFVTSTYYNDTLHPWVKDFNNKAPQDRWFGKEWTLFRASLDYTKHSGPDNITFEGTGFTQGRVFPHPMKGGLDKVGKKYYEAMTNSPRGNELLLELAKTAIKAEKMGQGDETDLLSLSFSSNDLIGHCWGPDSQEVLDVTLRSDLILKQLLDFLDAEVGKGQYTVVLSADHGICPIPELAKAEGKDAGRVSADALLRGGQAHLQATFAKDGKLRPWIDKMSGSWFYFNKGVLRELGLSSSTVEQALADWLVKQPGVEAAFIRSRVEGKSKLADPLAESVRLSFFSEASGDVKVLLKPYHLFSVNLTKSPAYATTHGSPYPYDTHVPLLAYGPGIRPGRHAERITPQTLATILARGIDLPLPAAAEAPLPEGVFERR
jgi:predicted AlkP superfamily pyrophosphatase or phosphodiesterase